jgi:exopolysaccharide biosynthesis polyprenyl glycosylphosphotransferase
MLANILAVAAVGVGASTRAAQWAHSRTAERAERRKRLLIVGAGPLATHLSREAVSQGIEVLGCVEDRERADADGAGERVLGTRADLPRLARDLGADEVVTIEPLSQAWVLAERLEAEGLSLPVLAVPSECEIALCPPTSSRLGDVALVRLPRRRTGGGGELAKRAFDLIVAVTSLVLLLPVILICALAIRLSGRGPVLFRQERVGRGGLIFKMVKFRTMVADAEAEGPRLCAGKRDPRLTRVGRVLRGTHLDELPQLWNVLKGEMSLVGPRPERPCFVAAFERELPRYGERHRILPGITGLAQVHGSYHSSPREKLRYDLMYLYHRSLWLDLCILARTLVAALG